MDTAEWRKELGVRYGALTLDTLVGPSSPTLSTIANALYHNLDGLLHVAKGMLELDPTATYYAFHSGRGVDLQITLLAGKPSASWAGSLERVERLSAAEERTLAEDAALRNAAGRIEVGGIKAAYDAIEQAISLAPQRPELMQFARQLVNVHKFSIAGKIVDARLTADPNDASALLLDAKMTMTLVNGRQWGKERLVDAEQRLTRALELSPDWLEARLLWADVPRYGGDLATSAERFVDLLRQHPDVDVAHFNLGVIFLTAEPARALEHFLAGERLAPQDADYPLNAARALLALQRADEAREAFERGAALDPQHRLLESLRKQLSES